MTAFRILLIEDELDIGTALAEHLTLEGYAVEHVTTGEEGLARALAAPPDLVVLDLMLPGLSGETVLRKLRDVGLTMPVLILSARDTEHEKVHGFRLGADDYVTKPFGLLELLARIRALLRRVGPRRPELAERRFTYGPYSFDLDRREVLLHGKPVALRPREYDLLFGLIERPGQTVTREALLRDIWHYASGVGSRTVDWHVAELRRKLSDGRHAPDFIVTVRKVGYRAEFRSLG